MVDKDSRQEVKILQKVNPQIFREYDIRGVVDKDLTEEFAEQLGKAYGTYVGRKGLSRVTAACDGRLSSERLKSALIRGMVSTGCQVTDVGLCPTPVFYFSIFHLDKEGGVTVTGSHNPPDYNGFKICVGKETIHGEQIQELRRIMEGGSYLSGQGGSDSYQILSDYRDHLLKNLHIEPGLKVVLDAGNGTAGLVAPRLFKDSRCQVTELYCEVDGTFPNHHPDPIVMENIRDLITTVREQEADMGVGYDGDSDRIGVIDEQGNILWGDQLLIIFSREILKDHKGATIVGEVKCSQTLYDEISRLGGNPIMWKAGHSLIKHKMREEGALLGGEMSGHIFFADRYYGYDDAIYASLRLAEILSATDRKLSEFLQDIPKTYSTPEIRTDCPDEIKFKVIERVKEYFKAKYRTVDVDGVRVIFDDGWGLIRASNTQPALVSRFEAFSQERLTGIKTLVEGKLKEVLESLAAPRAD